MIFDALYLMVPLLKDTSVLPGITLPLEVFILGVPKCNPNAKVLIRCPHLDLPEQALGAVEVVPEEPICHLFMLEQELEMVVSGEPTLPLLER